MILVVFSSFDVMVK